MQKFCAKHQQVVSCVKRLTSDVVPCAGKNWAELHIDFSTTCMYMYHITPRRDSICHLGRLVAYSMALHLDTAYICTSQIHQSSLIWFTTVI